jgi:ribonuclease BN (tRNA processing enzyme)
MWREAIEIAQRAQVGALSLFHHDPSRSDEGVEEIERDAQALFANTFAARERTVFDLESKTLMKINSNEVLWTPTK